MEKQIKKVVLAYSGGLDRVEIQGRALKGRDEGTIGGTGRAAAERNTYGDGE